MTQTHTDLPRRGTGRAPKSVDPVATRAMVLLALPADRWVTLAGLCEEMGLPAKAASPSGHVRAALEWLRIYGQAETRTVARTPVAEVPAGVSSYSARLWRRTA